MAGTILTFQGSLSLKTAAGSYTDMSSEITKAILKVEREDVKVPATLATPLSHLSGARKYTLEMGGFSTDGSTGLLFPMLWAAVGTASKLLTFKLLFRDGAVSPSNPQWVGDIIVAGTQLGADVGELSTQSITCTLTGKPTKTTA